MTREPTLRRMPSMHDLGVKRDRQKTLKRTETVLDSFGAKGVKQPKSSQYQPAEPLFPSTLQTGSYATPRAHQLRKSRSLCKLSPPSPPCTPLFSDHPKLSDPLSIVLPSTPFSQLDYSDCSDDAQMETAVRKRLPAKQFHLPSARSSSTSLYPPSTQPSPQLRVYTTIALAQSDVSLLAPSSLGLDMSPLSSGVSLPASLEAAVVKVVTRTEIASTQQNRTSDILASNTFYLPPVYTKPNLRSVKQVTATRPKPSPFKSCLSSNGIEMDIPRRGRQTPVEGYGSLRTLFTSRRATLPKGFKDKGLKVEISAPVPVFSTLGTKDTQQVDDKEWRQTLLTRAVGHSLKSQSRPPQRLRIPSILTGPAPISPCLTPTVEELEARRRLEMQDDGGLVLPDGFEVGMPKGRAATPLANALPPPKRRFANVEKADHECTSAVHPPHAESGRGPCVFDTPPSGGPKSSSPDSDPDETASKVLTWRQEVESNQGLVKLEDLLLRYEQTERERCHHV